MSRLTELEEQNIVGVLSRIRANHADSKLISQPTSVTSGVRTYQSPNSENWDTFEFVHRGSSTTTDKVLLTNTGGPLNMRLLAITTIFEPANQNSPVVYPFLDIMLGNQRWEPFYSPSLGLVFTNRDSSFTSILSAEYLIDKTDYGAKKLIYKYETNVNYGVGSSSGEYLKMRFRVRSTDRGKTKIKVVSYE